MCAGKESSYLCPCIYIMFPYGGELSENLVHSCVGLCECGAAVFVRFNGYDAGESGEYCVS